METPLTDLLSVRSINVLRGMGIHTIEQLARASRENILRQTNCGKKTIEEIDKLLSSYGLWYNTEKANTAIKELQEAIENCTAAFRELSAVISKLNIKFGDDQE